MLELGPIEYTIRHQGGQTGCFIKYCLCATEASLAGFVKGGLCIPEPIHPNTPEADKAKIQAMNATVAAACQPFVAGTSSWAVFSQAVADAINTRWGIA